MVCPLFQSAAGWRLKASAGPSFCTNLGGYLSWGPYVRPRSGSRLRRTTEALLGSSKRSREPRAHNLLFSRQIAAHKLEHVGVARIRFISAERCPL